MQNHETVVAVVTPTASGRELAEKVPLLDTIAELDFVQPMNIDSTNMRPRDWLCIKDVPRPRPCAAGAP